MRAQVRNVGWHYNPSNPRSCLQFDSQQEPPQPAFATALRRYTPAATSIIATLTTATATAAVQPAPSSPPPLICAISRRRRGATR